MVGRIVEQTLDVIQKKHHKVRVSGCDDRSGIGASTAPSDKATITLFLPSFLVSLEVLRALCE
jgi:hypothetical protein